MKNAFASLVLLLLTLVGLAASAQTIRRVNNTGISGTLIYADIQPAIAASAAGDIIQVEPSGTTYNGFTLDKAVTIVGPGYFLGPSQNPGLQANPVPATVNGMGVAATGAAATVAGLTFEGAIRVSASNFTIRRCNINRLFIESGVSITNLNIQQCFIASSLDAPFSSPSDNMLVANNIIQDVSFPANYNGGFFNNVVRGGATMSNFFVTNNYFANSYPSPAGTTLANNIGAATTFPTTNGNQANVAPSAVFVLAPGSTAFDAWYQLKSGTNPARGTGAGGTDVGAFSLFSTGAPYKLGGVPAIPAIYQQAQTITGNSLNGTLSTRANN